MSEDINPRSGGALAETGATGVLAPAEAQALALSGSRNVAFADRLTEQVALCQPLPADEAGRSHRMAAVTEALKELAPRNAMEGMLAGQMVAVHNVGLKLMAEAFRDGQPIKNIEAFLRQGTRALALFTRQMELMTRQRGKQRQSLRIEHEQVGAEGRVSVRAEEERVR
jgi:23S rRNA C2498 (ribose-2'-O)-methylase RlmM